MLAVIDEMRRTFSFNGRENTKETAALKIVARISSFVNLAATVLPHHGTRIGVPHRFMQSLYTVAITNRVFPQVLDCFGNGFAVNANTAKEPWPPDVWLHNIAVADAVITFMPDCFTAGILERCPKLRLISCALKGYDNFDIAACTCRGITVTVVEDLLTVPTAELAVGLIISLARNLMASDRLVRSGNFRGWRPVLYGAGLAGSSVGLLGMGRIGRAIAERLKPFDCTLLYWDRNRVAPELEVKLGIRPADWEELLERSDYVVLALPLTAETTHLIDRKALALMKPGAYLVNPARGSLVDEAAVAEALASGHLGGYAADVFEFEDWARSDRPSTVHPALIKATDRTIFTPHLGSGVRNVRLAIELQAAQNVLDFFSGKEPRGIVRPECRA